MRGATKIQYSLAHETKQKAWKIYDIYNRARQNRQILLTKFTFRYGERSLKRLNTNHVQQIPRKY